MILNICMYVCMYIFISHKKKQMEYKIKKKAKNTLQKNIQTQEK